MDALVVGPGLGRDGVSQKVVQQIVKRAKEMNIPMVVDADGLALVCADPTLVRGYRLAVLTPNKAEFQRLREAVKAEAEGVCSEEKRILQENEGGGGTEEEEREKVAAVARWLGNVTVCRKGQPDIISDGRHTVVCDAEGSWKRSGGQGDVLSGLLGTFVAWSKAKGKLTPHDDHCEGVPTLVAAAYGASTLVRVCSVAAFTKRRRSMTAPDLIHEIGDVFDRTYELDETRQLHRNSNL
eukprot:GDKI01002773.1.p1 GENE.GDKI01002773.1~~GDKI01002773.1.p1  ORF type:complete len:239 (-),score=62.70 GDKI01002773.1:134-850(-)